MLQREGHGAMAQFGLREAAKQAGVAKSTIHRAILRGRLSATRTEDGGYAIDASELFRLYPPSNSALHRSNGAQGHDAPSPAPPALVAENAALRTLLERERTLLESALTEARADRDAWKEQAQRLALAPPRTRAWWQWRKG